MKKLKIKLVKSRISRHPKHIKTLNALSLTKIGKEVIKPDNPQIRGMVRQVSYLVKMEEIDA